MSETGLCPCGCGRPVHDGRTYAAKGCHGRKTFHEMDADKRASIKARSVTARKAQARPVYERMGLTLDQLQAEYAACVTVEALAAKFRVDRGELMGFLRSEGLYRRRRFSRLRTLDEYLASLSKPDGESGCWMWTRNASAKGYGVVYREGQTHVPAHRWIWEQLVGPIPAGMVLDHLCRNTSCVNPAHLRATSNAVNTQSGVRAKMTADTVREMRRLYASGGVSQRALALQFGIHEETARSIVTRKSWSNIE